MIGYGSFSVVHPCKEVRQECNTVIKVPVPVRLEDSFGGRGFYSSEYQQGMYLKETSGAGILASADLAWDAGLKMCNGESCLLFMNGKK